MPENNKTSVATTAGIAGVVIGASVTAAAVALSDKKNRDRVAHTLDGFKKHAGDMLSSVRGEIEESEEKIAEEMREGKEAIDDIKEPTSKSDEKILKSL